MQNQKNGMLAALATYVIWGLLPLYWNLLASASAGEILAQRVCWSFLFMLLVLLAAKQWPQFLHDCRALWQDKRRGMLLAGATLLISLNWLIYIWAVNNDHIIDASIGYYINPLMSVLCGMLFFHERLSTLKKGSLLIAAIGIAIMTMQLGHLPWIAVALALTFAIYGVLKKKLQLNPLSSITLETLLMLPAALPYTVYLMQTPANHFGIEASVTALLIGTGVVTAIPLILFAYGANHLPLNVLGFFQYLSPTITLLLGIFIFHEPFGSDQLFAFSFIWAALLLFTSSEVLGQKQAAAHEPRPARQQS